MSWQTYRRRREVLLDVLRHARRDPGGPLPFECVPHATELFADRDELLRALHHRWTMLLTARLELATLDDAADRVSAVSAAWRELAADQPELRAILDSPAAEDVLRRAMRGEHRMLALWSGLAEPHEPADEVAAIGAAYAALLRTPPPSRPTPPLPSPPTPPPTPPYARVCRVRALSNAAYARVWRK